MNHENSFWGGKQSEAVDKLNADVPAMYEVKDKSRPMLEEWRKLGNVYYRHYNDGDPFANKLRYMAARFHTSLRGWSDESLEALADAVFAAAVLEQQKATEGKLNLDNTVTS
ncbi:MAG: hypothetical protein DRI24_13315 [Deltaproteobacteria bacterium]|nr:MAG: hypothetical protein DRI24_13315 [Deltaproteobacteria bacterium]